MTDLALIVDLKNCFAEDTWSWIIPALRQDKIVWQNLSNPDFGGMARRKFGAQPNNWTPLNLALLKSDLDPKFISLAPTDLENELPELYQAAWQAFNEYTANPKAEISLAHSGLVATYLFCHPEKTSTITHPTILACWLGYQPEFQTTWNQLPPEYLGHAILSQPRPPHALVKQLTNLLNTLSPQNQFRLLKYLNTHRPGVASELSQTWAKSKSAQDYIDYTQFFCFSAAQIAQQVTTADVHNLTDESALSLENISTAWINAQALQQSLAIKVICQKIIAGKTQSAFQDWKSLLGKVTHRTANQNAEVILALTENIEAAQLLTWFSEGIPSSLTTGTDPQHYLAQSYLQIQFNDLTQAQTHAQSALAAIEKVSPADKSIYEQCARLFELLEEIPKANQVLAIGLENYPNDLDILTRLLAVQNKAGSYHSAAQTGHILTALAPANIDFRRKLAQVLGANQEWQQALQQWETILNRDEQPRIEDLEAAAECALEASQPDMAVDLGLEMLQIAPNLPGGHRILGQAYMKLGEPLKAKTHFNQTLEIAPNQAQAWLALAELYQRVNERAQTIQTLQAALNALPNHPEIHLALGEYHLAEQATTQALDSFRQANNLAAAAEMVIDSEIKFRIAERYGHTLMELGHHQTAQKKLAAAVRESSNPALLHTYAKSLLATGEPLESLKHLEHAVELAPNNLEIQIDLANAKIASEMDLDDTRKLLLAILEKDAAHGTALALLAEVHEKLQEPELALEGFRQAINSGLQTDPAWYIRLSLGLGRVALTLNQNEIALATLKQAASRHPKNISVLQTLSKAFWVSNLESQAMHFAQAALDIDPTNSDLLDWFIERVIQFKDQAAAITAVKYALTQAPKRADLVAKLGWLYYYADDHQKATTVFSQINKFEHVSPTDLYSISQGFLALSDYKNAGLCLEKAINISESTGENYNLPKLYSQLAQVQHENGATNIALDTIEEAISIAPNSPDLLKSKAEILLTLDNNETAADWIEAALDKFPSDPELHILAAIAQYLLGNLSTAISHTQRSLDNFEENRSKPKSLEIVGRVADIAAAGLQFRLAEDILDIALSGSNDLAIEKALGFHCLRAELALEKNEEIAAAKGVTAALGINPNHPWVMALQARLTARQGDVASAEEKYQAALVKLAQFSQPTKINAENSPTSKVNSFEYATATYIGCGVTALFFQQWDVAENLLQQAIKIAPREPRTQINLARFLTLRAEAHQISQILNINRHSPSEEATSEQAYQEFETAILAARNELPQPDFPVSSVPIDEIDFWLARGQAVFQPSEDHGAALEKYSDSDQGLAAYIAALRRSGNLESAANKAVETYQKIGERVSDPILLAQIALAVIKKNPNIAQRATQTAVDLSIWHNLPERPIFHALQAFIAYHEGDINLQVKALQSALEIWPKEANWLVDLATALQTNFDDPDSHNLARESLEKAIQFDPHQANNYIRLSEFHQVNEDFEQVIQVLDQGAGNIPENAMLWLALTRIHQIRQDVPQIIRCATRVTQVDPGNTRAQLILANTALEIENPEKALYYSASVINIEPNNAEAHILRSKAFVDLAQPENALESLEQAISEIEPGIQLELERIRLIEQIQGTEAAFLVLETLAERKPDDPNVTSALAQMQAQKGNLQAAIQSAQQALAQTQMEADFELRTNNLTLLGRLLRKSGQLDAAVNYLSQTIAMQPDNANAYLELGRCFYEQRKAERALEVLEKAIQIRPNDPQAYYFAGLAYKEKQAFAEAQRMLRRAADLAPHDLTIQRQLGTTTVFNLVHNQVV
jgi:tetratricopeptide (TPR) repeat protein